jgi:hypothetical protein
MCSRQNLTLGLLPSGPFHTEGCGIAEAPGPGQAGGVERNNVISETRVNDAFCGVAYAPTSRVVSGMYFNTLFTQFRSDIGPPSPPPGE